MSCTDAFALGLRREVLISRDFPLLCVTGVFFFRMEGNTHGSSVFNPSFGSAF
jgi:hypothetical protein